MNIERRIYEKSDITFDWIIRHEPYNSLKENDPVSALMHTHDHCELYISHNAKPIYYFIREKMYELSCGDIVLVAPGIPHCAFVEKGEILIRTKVGIGSSVYSRFPEYMSTLLPRQEIVWHMNKLQYQAVMDQLSRIDKTMFSGEVGNELEIMLQVMLLWKQCVGYITDDSLFQEKYCPQLLKNILLWIQEDNRFLTISGNKEVAEHFHISENYVPRLFHKYYPLSLKSLLTGLKIQYAKKRLGEGLSVTETCFEAGFCDCSHFISTFHKYTGMTPGQYKKDTKKP